LTSWPSGTFVSSTPDLSATISVETLSVSRAKSGSPSFTNSPDFLCQAETTPLVTDSPTDGTLTSIIIVVTLKLIERPGRGGFSQQTACLALQRGRCACHALGYYQGGCSIIITSWRWNNAPKQTSKTPG